MWVDACMMVVSAAAIYRCSLKVMEQDLEKKSLLKGKQVIQELSSSHI